MPIYAIIIFIVLAAFFGLGFYLNSKTPKPEGCENKDLGCEGCSIVTCSNHPVKKEENK